MASQGFRLRVCKGPDVGRELIVDQSGAEGNAVGRSVVTVGRGSAPETGQHLWLGGDPLVSRRHATIEASARGYVLTDRGSMNGTWHNGRRLEPDAPVLLRDQDELRFGSDSVVQFEMLRPATVRKKADTPATPKLSTRTPARGAKAPAAEAERPKERFGRYAVYTLLAQRDTDRIDVAVDTTSGTRVALERFNAKLLPSRANKRVFADAGRAQRWQHPNIATVVDAGVEGGTLYVASRLVDGVTLAAIQDRFARDIDIPLAAHIIRQACAALSSVQGEDARFVHRNLSPHSIMLDLSGQVVLINFGFVPVKTLLESTKMLTPTEARFLSPEHLSGRGLDPRSDIFSLGIILYELLTQEPIDPRRKAVLPDVDTERPDVPPALAALTMRAIKVRRELRFRTAAEMEGELAAVLEALAPQYGAAAAAWMRKRFSGLSAAGPG